MPKHTDVQKFLQAVFGADYGTHAIFANLNPPAHTRDFTKLDDTRDCYLSVATFKAEALTNQRDGALEVRCLVINDVGTKVPEANVQLGLGTPTAKVITSAGNYQWWYRLASPVPKADWPEYFAEAERLVGTKLEGRDAVHLFRAPMGVNTKKGRGMFAVRLTELNPGIELSLNPPIGSVGKSGGFPTGPGPSSGTLGLDALRELLAMVPNDLERDGWIEVGHGLKAQCADDEDGFTVFDEWSQLHDSYNAAKTRAAWDSFGAGGLKTKGGMLRARAEGLDPDRFRKWDVKTVFDDGVVTPTVAAPAAGKRAGITATPYQWVDPDKITLRDWLYGKILIRKFISMTVAPGGVGKSSLVAVETLAQVTGKDLLGEKPSGALRVWLWNLEDPGEETTRKIQAAAKYYQITEKDIGGRLFVDSGRDQRLVIAEMDRSGPMIVRPVVSELVAQIRALQIDIVVIDPFVSSHEVPENDNTAQDMVVKEWGRVAELGGCAVHLVDHTRKSVPGVEVTTESSRGAKAKTDAARVVRVVNRMTETQGRTFGVIGPWRYFNTFNDKANMAPPADRRDWFYLESVGLGNGGGAAQAFAVGAGVVHGDDVGVARRWLPPSPQDLVTGDNWKAMVEAMGKELWRKDYQAGEKWIGNAVAKALNLDPKNEKDRKTVKEVLETWFKAGLLKEVMQQDDNRMSRKYIEITGGF